MMPADRHPAEGKREQGKENRNAVRTPLLGSCHGTFFGQPCKNDLEGIPVQQKKRFRMPLRAHLNRRLFSILRENFPGRGSRLKRIRQKKDTWEKKQKYGQQKQKLQFSLHFLFTRAFLFPNGNSLIIM